MLSVEISRVHTKPKVSRRAKGRGLEEKRACSFKTLCHALAGFDLVENLVDLFFLAECDQMFVQIVRR